MTLSGQALIGTELGERQGRAFAEGHTIRDYTRGEDHPLTEIR